MNKIKLYDEQVVIFEHVHHADDIYVTLENFTGLYRTKYRLAKAQNPNRILEIGVRAGYSAHAFLTACPTAVYLGIDAESKESGGFGNWWTWHARALLSPFNAWILLTNSHALTRIHGEFDLVHIDGDHGFCGALMDMELGFLSLADGGLMVVDDAAMPEVRSAIDCFVRRHPSTVEFYDSPNGDALIRRQP